MVLTFKFRGESKNGGAALAMATPIGTARCGLDPGGVSVVWGRGREDLLVLKGLLVIEFEGLCCEKSRLGTDCGDVAAIYRVRAGPWGCPESAWGLFDGRVLIGTNQETKNPYLVVGTSGLPPWRPALWERAILTRDDAAEGGRGPGWNEAVV